MTPFPPTGLTNGTTYYYVVTAVHPGGESGASAQVSATPEDTSHPVVLDDTFGVDGIALIEIIAPVGGGILRSRAHDIAIQSDGKIVAAGSCGNKEAIAVVRCTADGSLDTTPGEDWIVTTQLGLFEDEARGIAIQSDGKIVVPGYSNNGTDSDIAVVRYTADGSLDTTFGAGGIVTTPIGSSNDEAYGIAIQSDGKIVVAGSARGTSSGGSTAHYLTVVRYTEDGRLDTDFDVDGIVMTAMMTTPPSIAIQADGKIIVAGSTLGASGVNIYLARFAADGTLDTTFGSGGTALTPTEGKDGGTQGLAIQPDGKIVVAGTFAVSKDETFIVVARYTSEGSLDTSFDSDGLVIGPDGYFASDLALQPDGKIVLGGYTTPQNDMVLMRYE